MAFFKFGKRGDGGGKPSPDKAALPTLDVLRRRARHRLIGASILVLAAVVSFPMFFDAPPRPVAVDVPIVIPERNAAAGSVDSPLPTPAPAKAQPSLPVDSGPVPAASLAPATVAPATAPVPAPIAEPPRPEKTAAAPVNAPVPLAQASAPASTPTASIASTAPTASSLAPPGSASSANLTPEKSASAPKPVTTTATAGTTATATASPPAATDKPAFVLPDKGRFVVQVGAFADPAKVREVRQTVERSGLKTYTQEVTTPEGKRTRVRIGPLSTKVEAEKVVLRLKALNLTAAVLLL